MFLLGHVAVAYLCYSGYLYGRYRRLPRLAPVLAVLLGSQFANLIDKPLAWWVGVFPTGRDPAHSLLFAAVLIAAVYLAALAIERVELATAFVIAHLSYLLADIRPRFVLGYPANTEFLLWPALSHNTFGYDERLFDPSAAVKLVVTPFTDSLTFLALEVVLFGLAVGVWYVDGRPGLEYVRR